MNGKIKACFTPHAIAHSLFGLGLGIVLANQFAELNSSWIGLAIIVIAVITDMIRKA